MDAVFGKHASLGEPPCRTAPRRPELRPKPPACPCSFNPADGPAKDVLCFAPHFPPGCAEVQGSDESQSRSWKGRSQDLNPGSWGPAAMPANALPPSAAVRSRDGAPRTPWPAVLLGREVT